MLISDFSLLLIYFFVAQGVSFLCSLLEAVLLSITPQYVALLLKQNKRSGRILQSLKSDMSKPLTSILTLNTIAHTMGAAGVGAQATKLYGDEYLTVVSVILTLLILFFSEIIPKMMGTSYWRSYAGFTAIFCHYLTKILRPVIWISKILTLPFINTTIKKAFRHDEFKAITELAVEQGQMPKDQGLILKNLLEMDATTLKQIMTPRTVVFSVNANISVEQFCHQHDNKPFSRIPIHDGDIDNIIGFVMRDDLLLSQARGNGAKPLSELQRPIEMLVDKTHLLAAFNVMIRGRHHICLVINEYGEITGIVTLEDILEHLIGFEIVDERDEHVDMQKLAKKMDSKRRHERL